MGQIVRVVWVAGFAYSLVLSSVGNLASARLSPRAV
jgi:hypothetical protein